MLRILHPTLIFHGRLCVPQARGVILHFDSQLLGMIRTIGALLPISVLGIHLIDIRAAALAERVKVCTTLD